MIDRAAAQIGACARHRPAAGAGAPVAARLGGADALRIPPLGHRIAVARDDAFCFVYPAVLDGWRRAGRRARLSSRRWPMSRPTPPPMRSICRAAIPSCGPAGSPPPSLSRRPAPRRRRGQAGLWRMRRLHGARRGADRRRRPPPPDGRAAAAGHELCRAPPVARLSRRDPARRRTARPAPARAFAATNSTTRRWSDEGAATGCGRRPTPPGPTSAPRPAARLGLRLVHPPDRPASRRG